MCKGKLALVIFLAAVPGVHAVIITTPAGVLNNPSPTIVSDPPGLDVWMRRNVKNDGSVGITANYPRSGNGSVWFSLGANTGNAGKADWEFVPSASFGLLGQLGTVQYDWYRDAASVVNGWLHPAFRLIVDADGNIATTNDVVYLIYERCYNFPGCPAAPTNQWVTDSITSTTVLWLWWIGVGTDFIFNRTLADYQSGSYSSAPGFTVLNSSSLVLGVSVGVGSGWVGAAPSFLGAVDNVVVTSNTPGAASINHNFELEYDMAANLGWLPPDLGPGTTYSGLSFTCVNNGPNDAVNATCSIAASSGTISNVNCSPSPPVPLLPASPPNNVITCTYDFSVGTGGGGDTVETQVTFTVTAGSDFDSDPSNNTDSNSAPLPIVDALNDAASFPANTTQSYNVGANDQYGSGSLPGTASFTLLASTTCPGASITSPGGVASFQVPPSGTCVVDYRVCVISGCDTAQLVVTAQQQEPIPTLQWWGLALLSLLTAGVGVFLSRRILA